MKLLVIVFNFLIKLTVFGPSHVRRTIGQLKKIIRYAYENTKAYRSLYESVGITPEAIKTIEDLRKLPCVKKEMIREHLEELSVSIRGRSYVTTGGSTGISFGFYRDTGKNGYLACLTATSLRKKCSGSKTKRTGGFNVPRR